jgi:pSer/pThr/pTyr-binding forkhead associated (FHA) protein
MSFVIQLVQGRSVKLTQVKTEILRIGRGTNADIRSENPAVAFEHAIIEKDAGGFNITDKGSITGTYLNRKPVETARLAKGDVIEVGDLKIEVQVADAGKPLFLKMASAAVSQATGQAAEIGEDTGARYAAEAGVGSIAAKKLDYVDAYALRRPYLTKSTVAALLLIVALGVVGEVTRPGKQAVFMPGGVSGAHSRAKDASGANIAERCSACHSPWQSITDNKCAACHVMAPHSMQEIDPPLCFTCHAEHRGLARLAAIPDARCNECHRDLKKHVKTGEAQLAKQRFAAGRYSFADIQKVTSFGNEHPEFVFPTDPNNLKFNHKLHLAPGGVFNPIGKREVLNCNNCHNLVQMNNEFDPAPLKFDNHCQRCHKLTFDPRFPQREAPHGGDPGIVYGYILATYAGGGGNVDVMARPDQRRILRFKTEGSPVSGNTALTNAKNVVRFKCDKCHELVERDNLPVVDPPRILTKWFANATFTHTSHRNIDCEKCHNTVRQSAPTREVNMPARDKCTDCHGAKVGEGLKQTSSSCVACHAYHLRSKELKPVILAAGVGGTTAGAILDPLGGGDMLQTILFAAIVILLFVVLVPLGAALYQRMKPSKMAPAPRAAAPPPPPPAPSMGAPATQAPSAPAQPPMRASAPAEAAPTQMIDLGELKKPPVPVAADGKTEMLQWYGMLRCTSGPLEGQNFIIEEGGFYIGRDSTMSKVVINDGRISKRHVRIHPRNGKVFVVDEGSTNGTFLTAGGPRVTEHQLKRGDSIILADNAATFVYQI